MREKFYDPGPPHDSVGLGAPGVNLYLVIINQQMKDAWVVEEATKVATKRKYPHFDPIVGIDKERMALIFDADAVARHSFFPLIKSVKEERRRKFNEESSKREFESKQRPICCASHIDALIYSWYSCQLNRYYENFLQHRDISESVLAYRSLDVSTPRQVREVADYILHQGDVVAMCFDASDFFGSIPHDELKKNLIEVLGDDAELGRLPDDYFAIYKNVTRYGYVELEGLRKQFPSHSISRTRKKVGCIPIKNGKYMPEGSLLAYILEKDKQKLSLEGSSRLLQKHELHRGIPQGLAVSGVLANIAMINFDKKMHDLAVISGGIYRRYSDDILFVINPERQQEVKVELGVALAEMGLKINCKKTEIRYFSKKDEGIVTCTNEKGGPSRLQYLGIEFDGSNFYLRSQSVSRFHRKIRRSVARSAARLRKNGGRVLRYGQFYRIFLSGKQNFLTYSYNAHRALGSRSKIDKQINVLKIKQIIKDAVRKQMSS